MPFRLPYIQTTHMDSQNTNFKMSEQTHFLPLYFFNRKIIALQNFVVFPWCPWGLGRASQATRLWPHAGVLQRVLGHISLEVHVGVRIRNLEVPREGF